MSGRSGNLEKATAQDRAIVVDEYLIRMGELCPYCKDLDCAGRGTASDCVEWRPIECATLHSDATAPNEGIKCGP